MSDQMSTDTLELFCRNRAKASGELTEYDRALLVDVSDRLCALQAVNAELKQRLDKMNDFEKSQCAKLLKKLSRVEAERDAVIKDLNGLCWCCKHGKKWDKAPAWSKMTTCERMKERGVVAVGGGKSGCDHWEWRGVQGEG